VQNAQNVDLCLVLRNSTIETTSSTSINSLDCLSDTNDHLIYPLPYRLSATDRVQETSAPHKGRGLLTNLSEQALRSPSTQARNINQSIACSSEGEEEPAAENREPWSLPISPKWNLSHPMSYELASFARKFITTRCKGWARVGKEFWIDQLRLSLLSRSHHCPTV
jgi:hypothetical protein